jgi:hypothetical protein
MNRLFKSQYNLDLPLQDDALWIVYQFARESKAEEEARTVEWLLIKEAFFATGIPDEFVNKILQMNLRLKDITQCSNLASYSMLNNVIIRTPLIRLWSKLKPRQQSSFHYFLKGINEGKSTALDFLYNMPKWKPEMSIICKGESMFGPDGCRKYGTIVNYVR